MKWFALACSVAILLAIYSRIDLNGLAHRLIHVHPVYFGLALLCFVPQILLTTVRWRVMMAGIRPMTMGESLRMVMAGKALNALVPSKLGEMSKAYFLRQGGRVDAPRAVSAVILEKGMDLAGLCLVLLLGVLAAPEHDEPVLLGGAISGGVLAAVGFILLFPIGPMGESLTARGNPWARIGRLITGWAGVLTLWKSRTGRLPAIVGMSVLLWGFHVLQIYLFFPSLNHGVPWPAALAYVPLGILAGLLPITIGGMGTRDTALILLFAPYADATVMAGVGLLCSMRYWADTLLGIPFFHHYTRGGARKASPEAEVHPQT